MNQNSWQSTKKITVLAVFASKFAIMITIIDKKNAENYLLREFSYTQRTVVNTEQITESAIKFSQFLKIFCIIIVYSALHKSRQFYFVDFHEVL